MKKNKFTTIFSNIHLKPIVSAEKDKYLSTASINQLKKFIPDINIEENIDLLPIAFDACVVNRVNKNGDVIDALTASKIAKNFINKPINIEHNRNTVVGCILNYGFTEFGTSNKIEEKDIEKIKKPFNITLGGLVWKVVNQDLADKLEEANDPTSENYMSISASWELGFDEFNIVLLNNNEKNIENGQIISDAEEIEKYENSLKGFGGSGKVDENKYIYRQVLGKVIPLGIGLTLNPAADVKGVITAKEINPILISENPSKASDENNCSQNEQIDVKKERIYMKISKLEEITDSLLKEVTASAVIDFISEEIKKVNDQYLVEKNSKENALKDASEKINSVTAEYENVKKQLEEVNKKLGDIEKEQETKAKQEAFNMRMAAFDEEYDLADEDRKVLAEDIKDLNEEGFAAYKNKMAVLMKEKNKATKKSMKEKVDKEDLKDKGADEDKEDKNGKVIKSAIASEEAAQQVSTTQEVVEQAVDNGSKASTEIPNSAPASEPSVKEKYARAFSLEGFNIK
jgi:hypothetical protein